MAPLTRLAVLVSITVFISPFVAAQDFSVDVDVMTPVVTPEDGEVELFQINVTNDADVEQRFTIQMETRNNWYNGPYPYTMTLNPGESGTSIVYAQLSQDAVAGRKGVEITVTADSGEQAPVQRPSFLIRQDTDVIISEFSTDTDTYAPGETVTATLSVKNVINRELNENEYRAVFSLENETRTVPFSDLDPGEEETVTASFPLSPFDVGVMDLAVAIQDVNRETQLSKTANIEVTQVEDVQIQESTAFEIVSATTTIRAENIGNLPAEQTRVSSQVPSYLSYFVSFDTPPSATSAVDGSKTYRWNLGSLAPGDEAVVQYRVNYWIPVLLLVTILAATVTGIYLYRRPRIRKKSNHRNGARSIHLIVTNRSGKVIDNVIVKDFVPSIATLIEKFDSSPPEKIRQGGEGTELEWKLGRMNPGEKRILTYQVSPQVQVEGHVTLPKARLEYKTQNRTKKRNSRHAHALFR